jgi:tetratricopeptide (TPR) repeat protein
LAILCEKQMKYREAELLYLRVIKIREEQLGPEHIDTALSVSTLAILYHKLGDYKRAEPLYRRALEIHGRQEVQEADMIRVLNNLALLYKRQGLNEQAEPCYRLVLQMREARLGPDDPETVRSRHNLAAVYHNQGKYEDYVAIQQTIKPQGKSGSWKDVLHFFSRRED